MCVALGLSASEPVACASSVVVGTCVCVYVCVWLAPAVPVPVFGGSIGAPGVTVGETGMGTRGVTGREGWRGLTVAVTRVVTMVVVVVVSKMEGGLSGKVSFEVLGLVRWKGLCGERPRGEEGERAARRGGERGEI